MQSMDLISDTTVVFRNKASVSVISEWNPSQGNAHWEHVCSTEILDGTRTQMFRAHGDLETLWRLETRAQFWSGLCHLVVLPYINHLNYENLSFSMRKNNNYYHYNFWNSFLSQNCTKSNENQYALTLCVSIHDCIFDQGRAEMSLREMNQLQGRHPKDEDWSKFTTFQENHSPWHVYRNWKCGGVEKSPLVSFFSKLLI